MDFDDCEISLRSDFLLRRHKRYVSPNVSVHLVPYMAS